MPRTGHTSQYYSILIIVFKEWACRGPQHVQCSVSCRTNSAIYVFLCQVGMQGVP